MSAGGQPVEAPLDELLQRFSADQTNRGLKPKYIRRFGRDLDWLTEFAVRRCGKDGTLSTLDEKDVRAFLAWVQDDWSLKPGTADQIRTRLHLFFYWLKSQGLIARDPMAKIKRMAPSPPGKR